MPTPWAPSSVDRYVGGQALYTVVVGGKDVTYFRNVPTQLTSYSSADPFGDSTAQITFPQISIFDDIGNGDLHWLKDFADVTIYLFQWPGTTDYNTVSSLSLEDQIGYRTPIWEGFISSFEWHQDNTAATLALQCVGACFQVDQYLAKPEYPGRPIPYEKLIKECFSRKKHPALRTAPLQIEFYSGWATQAPDYANSPSYLTPVGVTPGENITGFFSRSTGAWDKSLTSFIQGLLGVMLDEYGQQWTIRLDPGRQPVLYVRQMFDLSPTYTVSAGQPGVAVDLTRDLTQFANVFFGQGTDQAGTEWDRQEVSNNGQETEYAPLAYDPEVYPTTHNPRFNSNKMTVEAYNKFDNGFDERQALNAAKTILQRDMDPGLAGTLTLTVDPQTAFMGKMKAGETVKITDLAGTGARGIIFSITQASHDVMNRTVTLTIDTKFRDLLTVEEVLARTRDPLTPLQLLKTNSRQLLVQDTLVPWNYKKGSGFIPNNIDFYKDIKPGEQFPFPNQSTRYSPKKHPHMYVKVKAHAKSSLDRWTTFPIRLSEAGAMRQVEVAAYDEDGNVLKIPFHFSIYYLKVDGSSMPQLNNVYSPFLPNAFESTNQFGEEIPSGTPGANQLPQNSLIVGWGNKEQPAGYSPGMKSAGDPCSGLLIDNASWDWTMVGNNGKFDPNAAGPSREPSLAAIAYGIVYAEYSDYVFFRGRMFRVEPGNS